MGRKKLTKILVEAGIDTKMLNNQGDTSRNIAERKTFTDVIAILDDRLRLIVNNKNSLPQSNLFSTMQRIISDLDQRSIETESEGSKHT